MIRFSKPSVAGYSGAWFMSVLLESGVNIKPVITHRFHFSEFEKGFAAMESGNCGKVVLDWSA